MVSQIIDNVKHYLDILVNHPCYKTFSIKQFRTCANSGLYSGCNLKSASHCVFQGPEQQSDLNTVKLLICEPHQTVNSVSIHLK
jgi:hypothetical protein